MGVSQTNEGSKTAKFSILDLVREAIKTTGLPRKGASFVNIRKFTLESDENADPKRLVRSLKLALKKGLDSGILIRPNHCKNSVGATGSFLLGKAIPTKMTKVPVKKSKDTDMEPEVQQKSKDAKKTKKSSQKKAKDPETKSKASAKNKAPQKTTKVPAKASKVKKTKDTDGITEDLEKIAKVPEKSKNQVKKTKVPEKTKAAEKKSKVVEKKQKAVPKESKVLEKKSKDQEKKSKVAIPKASEKNMTRGRNIRATKNSKTVDEPTASKVTPKTSEKVKVVMKAKRTNNTSKPESDFPDTPKISVPPSKGNHSIRLLSATGSKRAAIAYTFRPSIVQLSGKKILKKYAKMRVQKGLPAGTDVNETKIVESEKPISTKPGKSKAVVKQGKNAKSKKVESSSQGMKKKATNMKKLYSTPVNINRNGVFDPEHDASLIGAHQTKLVFSDTESSDTEEYIESAKNKKDSSSSSETGYQSLDTNIVAKKNKRYEKPNISLSDTELTFVESRTALTKVKKTGKAQGYESLDTEVVAKKNKRHEKPKISLSDTELSFVQPDTGLSKGKKTGKAQSNASLDTEIVAKKNKRHEKPKISLSDTELSFVKPDTVSTKGKKTGKAQNNASLDTKIVAKNKRHQKQKVSLSDTELSFVKPDTVSTKGKKTRKAEGQKRITRPSSKK